MSSMARRKKIPAAKMPAGNFYFFVDYAAGFSVILRSFGSKNVMMNGYTLPSSNFWRSSSSPENSEMWTSPATPSSIEASAPC